MINRKVISTSYKFALRCRNRFFTSGSINLCAHQKEFHDEWNNWEFGSFTTRKRKTTEQASVEKNLHCQNRRSSVSRNIDNEWSYLSDKEVEIGIEALTTSSTETRRHKLETILAKRTTNVRFVFEDPHNPNNLWAALRTADSFGIQYVDIIVNEGHSPALLQKSMVQALGSQKWLTLTQHTSTTACLDSLKSQGYCIIASDLSENSKPIGALQWHSCSRGDSDDAAGSPNRGMFHERSDENVKSVDNVDNNMDNGDSRNECDTRIAIVMGSEKTGISQSMRNQADELFHLPMKGFAESFNLAAASAITCAYLDAMNLLTPSLIPPLKRRILLTWLVRSVDGSMPLLRKAGLNVGLDRKPPYAVICGVNSRP